MALLASTKAAARKSMGLGRKTMDFSVELRDVESEGFAKNLFAKADKDGDGQISYEEFESVCSAIKKDAVGKYQATTELREKVARQRRTLGHVKIGGLLMLLIVTILLAGNTGLMMWALQVTKQFSIHSSGALTLTDSEGKVAKVALAQQDAVPFLIAPVLTVQELSEVKFLHVSLPTHVAGFNVIGFDLYSKTRMRFHTAEGYDLHVDNGFTYLRMGANQTVQVCTANITCSAFNIKGLDVPSLTQQALHALDAAADTVNHTASRLLTESMNVKDLAAAPNFDFTSTRLSLLRAALGVESFADVSLTYHRFLQSQTYTAKCNRQRRGRQRRALSTLNSLETEVLVDGANELFNLNMNECMLTTLSSFIYNLLVLLEYKDTKNVKKDVRLVAQQMYLYYNCRENYFYHYYDEGVQVVQKERNDGSFIDYNVKEEIGKMQTAKSTVQKAYYYTEAILQYFYSYDGKSGS